MLISQTVDQLRILQPELIFFDIDGTLLNTHGQYSIELKEQLHRLAAQGVKLAIASGRPAFAAQFLFDDLPVLDAGLFCTGAEIYDPKQKKHLKLHALHPTTVDNLSDAVKDKAFYCEIYTPEFYSVYQARQPITELHSSHLRVQPRHTVEELFDMDVPITKLLLGGEESRCANQFYELQQAFPELEFAFAHFLACPDWLFASVISNQADKNRGFDYLLQFHQVDKRQVIAFGDSYSDRTFLRKAGLGVAMGNAKDTLKIDADLVTLSADDNGVAQVLQHLNRK